MRATEAMRAKQDAGVFSSGKRCSPRAGYSITYFKGNEVHGVLRPPSAAVAGDATLTGDLERDES